MALLTTVFDYPVSMIGLSHAQRSNTLPPTIALLALAVWQCGAMLIFEKPANRWLLRPRVWLGVVVANSMVMTFYLWNMTAAVLAAVILLPTGIAPQFEELSGAWWLWRLGWIAACAICLVPFLFAFRWAERPVAPPPPAPAGWSGLVMSLAGVACASAGMSIIAAAAFPVQGEVLAMPLLGVACLVVGAILLHATLVAQGAAWVAHDHEALRLSRTIELRLARGAYLPALLAGTQMPFERNLHSTTLHLYCADPSDGFAKFELVTPDRIGGDVQKGDPRTPLTDFVVRVDETAEPFRERLELTLSIDDDLILEATARSSNVGDAVTRSVHDLEFAISLPVRPDAPSGSGKSSHLDSEAQHEPGDLVVRSNIAAEADESLVPGELLYTYKPQQFLIGLGASKLQRDERLYYQPCAVCGRRWGDPACRCATRPERRAG